MANTKVSDNPSPSLLMAEHVDPSNPPSGFQRLFVDTDHIFKMVDSAGTVTTFGQGLTDPMTTRGDIIVRNASNVTARLARGTSAQVLTSDGTDVAWATPSAGFSDPMTTRGDVIIRNASNVTARLGKGSANQVLTSDGTDIAWAAPSGASGLTHSTVGYTTIGGTSAAMTQYDHYLKKITLASASLIASVSFYTKNTAGGAANSLIAGVWDDNSGAPKHIRAASSLAVAVGTGYWPETVSGVAADAQWLTMPIGVWLAAGDYWIGFTNHNVSNYAIYYDGSGSDRKWTGTGGNLTGASTRYTITTTSNKYSIYADILS